MNDAYRNFKPAGEFPALCSTAAHALMTLLLCVLLLMSGTHAARAEWYVLAVGVETFDSSEVSPLPGTAADAVAIAEAMRAFSETKDANIFVLTTRGVKAWQPTRDNILGAIDQIKAKATSDDDVLVYISTHGVEINGTSYFIPSDIASLDADSLQKAAISATTLQEKLASIPARSVITAYDMCRSVVPKSGSLPTGVRLADPSAKDLYPKVNSSSGSGPSGSVSIFACEPGKRSYMNLEENRSYFGMSLESILRGEGTAASGSSPVLVTGLLENLPDAVETIVKKQRRLRQVPDHVSAGRVDRIVLTQPAAQGKDLTGRFFAKKENADLSSNQGIHTSESGIPSDLVEMLRNWRNDDERILSVAIDSSGNWIAASDNHYQISAGVPDRDTIKQNFNECIKKYGQLRFVTAVPGGGWVALFGDSGYSYPTKLGDSFGKDLMEKAKDGKYSYVSFNPSGGYIIGAGSNGYLYHDVADSVINKLKEINSNSKTIRQVVFDSKGEALILFEDNEFTVTNSFAGAELSWIALWQFSLHRRIDCMAAGPGNSWLLVTP